MWTVAWLIIAAGMVVAEIISLGLTTIWFAGGALITALVAHLGAHWILQIIVFAIVSLILLFFTRPIAQKHMMKNNEKTNVESLIGQTCIVTEEINNLKATGTVMINGLEWTARAENSDIIEKDVEVEVHSVSGVKLIVTKKV